MDPEGSLPHSQVPTTCPYPEPVRSSPYPHIPHPEYPRLLRSRLSSKRNLSTRQAVMTDSPVNILETHHLPGTGWTLSTCVCRLSRFFAAHPSSSYCAPFGPCDVTKSAVAELLDIRVSVSLCYAISVLASEQSACCLCRVLGVHSFHLIYSIR